MIDPGRSDARRVGLPAPGLVAPQTGPLPPITPPPTQGEWELARAKERLTDEQKRLDMLKLRMRILARGGRS